MILVDCNPIKGRRCWYIMTSDESLEELHAFGERIGLKRAWYRNGKHPHYGIVDSFRRVAIEQGAREASMREIVAALVAALMTGGTFGFMAAAILTNSKRCDIQSGEDKQ